MTSLDQWIHGCAGEAAIGPATSATAAAYIYHDESPLYMYMMNYKQQQQHMHL